MFMSISMHQFIIRTLIVIARMASVAVLPGTPSMFNRSTYRIIAPVREDLRGGKFGIWHKLPI